MSDLELSIEPLERREMLAGNVLATVNSGGDLIITGDDANNQIRIHRDSETNRIHVTGISDTLVNGDDSHASFHVTDDVIISTKGGIDLLVIGHGEERLNLPDDLIIDSGDDRDEIVATVDVDNLRINTGGGNDVVRMFADDGEETIIGGVATIITGDGHDEVELSNVEFAGRMTVRTGRGNDNFRLIEPFNFSSQRDGHLKVNTGGR